MNKRKMAGYVVNIFFRIKVSGLKIKKRIEERLNPLS
jgi:hypothetical protein